MVRQKVIFFVFLIGIVFAIGPDTAQTGIYKSSAKKMKLAVESDFDGGFESNLVKNASFELVQKGLPQNWCWRSTRADADCQIVEDARTGRHAVKLRNRSPKAPHVFGQLLYRESITLVPGENYTISAYIKTDEPGTAWIGGGGKSWWVRLTFKDTDKEWQRFEKNFIATEKDNKFKLMIVTTSPTNSLIIDDVKLEKGPQATIFFDPSLYDQEVIFFNDIPKEVVTQTQDVVLSVDIYLKEGVALKSVWMKIVNSSGQVQAKGKADKLKTGLNHLTMHWNPDHNLKNNYAIQFQIGKIKRTYEFELFTPDRYTDSRKTTLSQINMLAQGIQEANQSHIPVNYPKAAMAVANRFIKIATQKKDLGLLHESIKDIEYIGDLCVDQLKILQNVQNGTAPAWVIPDPPLDQIKIHSGNFWVEEKPVMLIGALGYGELKNDLTTYRDYGFNSIGDDYDVYSSFKMLTSENQIDETAVPRLIDSWKQLNEMNLAVSYTPHLTKIPDWALEKYPDIIGGRTLDELPHWAPKLKRVGRGPGLYGRFFPFSIDSANLKLMVEKYYASLIPNLKNAPGFQVFWLMNEPSYQSCDEQYIEKFHNYLRNKFKTILELNEAWGANFKDFSKIECPTKSNNANNYDWYTFNREQVYDWFEWLSQTIRKYYPDSVLSNKPCSHTFLQPQWSIDFEREAELWNIPGSDTQRKHSHLRYAYDWSEQSVMLFDFQKSIAPNKPLADHEFHYAHEPNVSADYVYTAYLHSYFHGLRMSQFWIWATGDMVGTSEYPGLNFTSWSQPATAWGTAKAALDLRRLAAYIALFPQKPDVGIYFSSPSLFVDGNAYADTLIKTYEAANGLDAPIGFVTDRMIHKGRLKDYKLLIITNAENIEANTRQAIQEFLKDGGHVAMTDNSLSKNQYEQPYKKYIKDFYHTLHKIEFTFKRNQLKTLAAQLDSIFNLAGVYRPVRIRQKNGDLAWPIEMRTAFLNNELLCYIVGLNKKPIEVSLKTNEESSGWKDLLTGENGQNILIIKPLDIRIVVLK